MTKFLKDPEAVLDYVIDWSTWLPSGDTIATSTWTVPAGLTKTTDSSTTTTATVWLSGGTLYETYSVVNRITTTQGRTQDQTLTIAIQSS